MSEESQDWYLLKHEDEALFGPIAFDQLKEWAEDAQISPLDKVSTDQKSWIKAPMVPGLGMDYLVEVSPDQFYGPTTLGAVREFYQMGEINADTRVTNCKDSSDRPLKDVPGVMPIGGEDDSQPGRASIRLNLQKRIRELEELVMEERRGREIAEHLVEKLEAKLAEITRAATM